MAWAIITIYTSKCAQMDPNSYLKRQDFIPDAKSVTLKKLSGVGSPKVNMQHRDACTTRSVMKVIRCLIKVVTHHDLLEKSFSDCVLSIVNRVPILRLMVWHRRKQIIGH